MHPEDMRIKLDLATDQSVRLLHSVLGEPRLLCLLTEYPDKKLWLCAEVHKDKVEYLVRDKLTEPKYSRSYDTLEDAMRLYLVVREDGWKANQVFTIRDRW